MSNGGQHPPFPWRWYLALIGCAAATGAAFAAARWAGIAMACVTVAVIIGFMIWAVRLGRKRRAAGHKPDIPALQRRLHPHMKRMLLLALLSVVAAGFALATNHNNTPTWLLVAGPALLLLGLAWTWVLAKYLLPKMQQKQDGRSDGTSE